MGAPDLLLPDSSNLYGSWFSAVDSTRECSPAFTIEHVVDGLLTYTVTDKRDHPGTMEVGEFFPFAFEPSTNTGDARPRHDTGS